MLLGMVTVNATTFLIGQNSLVCLNDFLQNNDPEPRTGLADHKRRPNEIRSKGHRIQNRALTESIKEAFYMFLAMGLKYFDYTMSGILLFIVTWRAKFVAKGDESLWWHICRIFNSVLLTIFCIFGVPLMSMFYNHTIDTYESFCLYDVQCLLHHCKLLSMVQTGMAKNGIKQKELDVIQSSEC